MKAPVLDSYLPWTHKGVYKIGRVQFMVMECPFCGTLAHFECENIHDPPTFADYYNVLGEDHECVNCGCALKEIACQ